MDSKVCTRCGIDQPVDAFLKIIRRGKPALSSWCRTCRTEAARQWRASHREQERTTEKRRYATRREDEQFLSYRRAYSRERRQTDAGKREVRGFRLASYGLSHDDFDQMFAEQDGRCAICGVEPERTINIDHCHECGQVRKLLCHNCNRGLGAFGDSIERLRAAVAYLEQHTH